MGTSTKISPELPNLLTSNSYYLWFSHIRNWFISFAHVIHVMDMRSVMNLSSTPLWIGIIRNYSQPCFFPWLFPNPNTVES